MKDLKKIDAQETEEQLKHHEVEGIGGKGPSKFWQLDADPHCREDHEEENKIILSKHSGFLFQSNGSPLVFHGSTSV
jgi:hypothetical protein